MPDGAIDQYPDPDRIDKAGKAVMAADPQAGGVFAAMADGRPAVIRAGITCRAQDVDLVPAARPVFMAPHLAGRRIHRQPLRVAVPDGEDLRRPARFPLSVTCGLPGCASPSGVRRMMLAACVDGFCPLSRSPRSPSRPQRGAGDMKPAAEMMPASRRHVTGEEGAPSDQPVTLDHRAVDGRRRPARPGWRCSRDRHDR